MLENAATAPAHAIEAAHAPAASITATTAPGTLPDNPAVIQCCEAYRATYHRVRATDGDWDARKAASKAFRDAMPPLFGSRNIRSFIACVARGLLLEAIDNDDAARLLYAAQVANSAHLRHTKHSRRNRNPAAPASSGQTCTHPPTP